MRYAAAFLALSLCGCYWSQLNVKSIGKPDYPVEARVEGIEGTVVVDVHIGSNGKVVRANGSGKDHILVRAAEQNVRQWIFGPFPPHFKFPMYTRISYDFKLKGHPSTFVTEITIRRHFSDRIEITAQPIKPDNVLVRKPSS